MYINPSECITRFRVVETEEYVMEHIVCCTDPECVKETLKEIGDKFGELEEVETYYQCDEPAQCDCCGVEIGSGNLEYNEQNEGSDSPNIQEPVIHRLEVAKIKQEDLDKLESFLSELSDKIEEFESLSPDDQEANQIIGKLVRSKLPIRASYIGLINLQILLDNYQDEASDVLKHPKWIGDLFQLISEIDKSLTINGNVSSEIIKLIKEIVDEE